MTILTQNGVLVSTVGNQIEIQDVGNGHGLIVLRTVPDSQSSLFPDRPGVWVYFSSLANATSIFAQIKAALIGGAIFFDVTTAVP